MTKVLAVFAVIAAGLVAWTWVAAARTASRHKPQGVFVTAAGGRMHLVDMGPRDAPPERTIVMIHGASCNHLALALPLARPLLDAGFRVIAIDRPGHGHSERPGGRSDASPARQAAIIAEAMAAAGAPQAIVLAHSFAGAIATALAIDHPAHVKGLVLIAPATHPWPGGVAWYHHPASWPVVDILFSNSLPVAGFALTARAGVDQVFTPQPTPEGYIEATALPLMLRPASFRANSQDMVGLQAHVRNWSPRYGEIRQPTVVIAGDVDKVVSTTIHTMALVKQAPDAKVVILPGVGHVPHHADPARVVAEAKALSVRLKP